MPPSATRSWIAELVHKTRVDVDVDIVRMEMGVLDLPVHPIVVHFRIAMLTTAWLLVVLGHVTRNGERRFLGHVSMFETIGVLAFVPPSSPAFVMPVGSKSSAAHRGHGPCSGILSPGF